MWTSLVISGILSFTAGQLLQPLPQGFNTSTNTVFLGPEQFILPWQFSRASESQLSGTTTNDTAVNDELVQISRANFIAFDSAFFDIIGPNATCEKMFNVSMAVHEAPLWLPDTNTIIVSPQNQSYQIVIDLNSDPPTMSNLSADPPVYSINGAWLLNGTIIWGTNGINLTAPPGLFTFDPKTNKSTTLLNNYRGLRFATPDDLVVDQNGNILFTDAPFAYVNDIVPYPPEMPSGVWSFNPGTGRLKVIDDSLDWPNGIAFAPGNTTVYVTNTPLTANGSINPLLARGVYAYNYSAETSTLTNRRLIYVCDVHVSDGIKVAETGLIFTAAGSSIDVVDPTDGVLLGKIVTSNETMNNLVAIPGGEWWFTGQGGIWRARIATQGTVNYG